MRNRQIDHGLEFDWGRASEDYAKYRDIYPERFFQEIRGLGLCERGRNVLDLGTGTGVLPRHLSRFGAHFTGVDISENQIGQARRLTKEAGLDIDMWSVRRRVWISRIIPLMRFWPASASCTLIKRRFSKRYTDC